MRRSRFSEKLSVKRGQLHFDTFDIFHQSILLNPPFFFQEVEVYYLRRLILNKVSISSQDSLGNKNSEIERDHRLVLTPSPQPQFQPNSKFAGLDSLQPTLGIAPAQRELSQLVEVCCAILLGFREYQLGAFSQADACDR